MKELFANNNGIEIEKRAIFLFIILFSIAAIALPEVHGNENRDAIQAIINQASEKMKQELATKEDMLYVPRGQRFWIGKRQVTNLGFHCDEVRTPPFLSDEVKNLPSLIRRLRYQKWVNIEVT